MNINVDIYLRSAFRDLEAFSIPELGTFRKTYAEDDSLDAWLKSNIIRFEPVVDPKVSLVRYLVDHIQIEAESAAQIVSQIRRIIQDALAHKGKFEIPEIGLLKQTKNGTLVFENYGSESADVDDPLRVVHSILQTHSPTHDKTNFMEHKSPVALRSRPSGASGWKSALLVLLLAALGFLLVNHSPFVKYRSQYAVVVLPDSDLDTGSESLLAMSEEADPADNTLLEALPPAPIPESPNQPQARLGTTDPGLGDLDALNTEGANSRLSRGNTRGMDAPQTPEGSSEETGSLSDLDGGNTNARLAKPNQTYFHLIAGSFRDVATANEYLTQLKSEGYNPIIIYPPAGSSLTHRVSIFRSEDRKAVEAYAEKLKQMGKKSGWILEEKP